MNRSLKFQDLLVCWASKWRIVMCKVQSKVNEQQSQGDHRRAAFSPPHPVANAIEGPIRVGLNCTECTLMATWEDIYS